MLLPSLKSSSTPDIADAVSIGGTVLSRSDLVGAATAVAERVAGPGRVAVLATPTVATVLAVTGCLIAGVPFVASRSRSVASDPECHSSQCAPTPAPPHAPTS